MAYWAAAAAIDTFGTGGLGGAHCPNLLYALITALAVGLLARRSAGPIAGLVAAAAISTFLLSYQVEIWLATDAPLLAAVAVALLGVYIGFYAERSRERLRGYALMHAALALGFMSKSAAAWMVPALAILTLVIWERRWRELLRWELYAGLLLQAAVILTWVWFVYVAPDGPAHLKVFFWNNLVGRFAHLDAPQEMQYATGHRNSPGKYLAELPLYVWPWTLLVVAAARRAWRARGAPSDERRPVRFALASSLPALAVLSVAATARNIYFAPALPGFALLLGWWGREAARERRSMGDLRRARHGGVDVACGNRDRLRRRHRGPRCVGQDEQPRELHLDFRARPRRRPRFSPCVPPLRSATDECCELSSLCCSRTAPCWRDLRRRSTGRSINGRTLHGSAARSRPMPTAGP